MQTLTTEERIALVVDDRVSQLEAANDVLYDVYERYFGTTDYAKSLKEIQDHQEVIGHTLWMVSNLFHAFIRDICAAQDTETNGTEYYLDTLRKVYGPLLNEEVRA